MGRSKLPRKVDSVIKSKILSSAQEKSSKGFVTISCDELEALRLCDLKGFYQIEAARKMEVSRATLARILFEGRRKAITAIIKGIKIKIVKGNVKFENEKLICPIHKEKKRKGRICLCRNTGEK